MIASFNNLQQRIFLPISTTNIYQSDNILTLIQTQPKFQHLLSQHQQAIAAELISKWSRADFFFRQVYLEFKTLLKQPQEWEHLVATISNYGYVMTSEQLRRSILRELFIDTHYAFYNGLISKTEQPQWNARCFVHIDYIQQWLELSVFSDEEVLSLLAEGWRQRINTCKNTKKWRPAINCCQQRLKLLPHNIDFQGELAEIYYFETLARCSQINSQWQHSQNVRKLQHGINKLEKLLKQYPHCPITFQLLSSLYHIRALNLSHINQIAKSLVSIQKAVSYNPFSKKAYQTRNELVELMTQLQQQMSGYIVDIKRRGMQLNHKGLQLLNQVNIGFKPMNNYINSEEAKQITTAYKIAEAIYVWHRIGLPEPQDTTTALRLNEALYSILQHPPQTKAEIATVWENIVKKQPHLASLSNTRVCSYLEECLFRERAVPPIPEIPPPVLTPILTKPQMSTEPLIPWLLSPQDKRIKLQALVASVLIAATGFVMVREKTTIAKRDNAYQDILTAQQTQNDEAVLKATKNFFQNQSFISKDERTSQITEIYQEALVRWFVQQPKAEITPEQQQYLDLYSKYVQEN
ncbi:MAG: hypothetical protein IGS39_16340 [Calothrix sp. C42_A2020_038]|nr:hypothetical protein [Calothrix sp. C42_A2020_038]